MSSIVSIAEALGISASTVSRALKRPDKVAAKTRNLILDEAKKQGYLSDGAVVPRHERVSRSRLIGILVADLSNSFSNAIVSAVQDVAYAHEYSTVVGCTYEHSSLETKILKQWQELCLSGLIIMPTQNFANNKELLGQVPFVTVDRDVKGVQCDKFLDDNQYGMESAIDHLMKLGHEKIAVFSGSRAVYTFLERSRAALDYCPQCELIDINALSYEELYMGAFEQLNILFMRDEKYRPTAVIAENNALAAGCLYAANLRGIRMPSQLSLAAFGDSHWMRFYPVPVTAMRQNVEQMGANAAYRLLQRIKGDASPFVTELLKPMLMVRNSTGTAASSQQGASSAAG